jgi:hypothetical protein
MTNYCLLLCAFRKPVMSNSAVRVHAKLVDVTDRKRYLQSTMYNLLTNDIVAEATALFVLPKNTKAGAPGSQF